MDAKKNVSIAKEIDRAAGIVIHQGKILLMRRINCGKEYYTFPGGGVEKGEKPSYAAKRELKEETSVVARVERLLYEVLWSGKTKQYFYQCEYLSGVPKLEEGTVEWELMKSDLEQYYEPIFMDISLLPKTLLYPLEVRDELILDLKSGFGEEVKCMTLDLATARQEL